MTQTRAPWVNITLLGLAALVFAVLVGLGTWQVKRLAWKQDLIAQIEARAYATPVPAPIDTAPAYLNVTISGRFDHSQHLRIKAVTDIGAGFWIMSPLMSDAQTIWVNLGFVPTALNIDQWVLPQGPQTLTGLARLPIANGTWLEKNDPQTDRWFSPDLTAMSAHLALDANTAYYIDAARAENATSFPRAGLTRLTLRNTHLSYALTWYALAALLLGGVIYAIADHRRSPH
ncbi:SURF1 family protein [Octadecabacter sp.]|nr:SURF1 family protein [Octadecabacter sp.]